MTLSKTLILLTGSAFVAACNGNVGAIVPAAEPARSEAPQEQPEEAQEQTFVEYDLATVSEGETGQISIGGTAGNRTFTVNGTELPGFIPDSVVNNAIFSGSKFAAIRQDASQDNKFLLAETANGQVAVGASSFADDPFASGTMSRNGETRLPTTGSAQYSGEYAGLLTSRREARTEPLNNIDGIIKGVAELTADLGAGSVSGSIRNRRAFFPSTGEGPFATERLEYVTLNPATADAKGVFRGTTSGGVIYTRVGSSETPNGVTNGTGTGTHASIFAGSDGQELLGIVTIPHNAGTGRNIPYPKHGAVEIGGFVTDRQ